MPENNQLLADAVVHLVHDVCDLPANSLDIPSLFHCASGSGLIWTSHKGHQAQHWPWRQGLNSPVGDLWVRDDVPSFKLKSIDKALLQRTPISSCILNRRAKTVEAQAPFDPGDTKTAQPYQLPKTGEHIRFVILSLLKITGIRPLNNDIRLYFPPSHLPSSRSASEPRQCNRKAYPDLSRNTKAPIMPNFL